MLETSSLRRKHSSSPTDAKSGAANPFSTSNSSRASPSSLAVKSNDDSTAVDGDVYMQEDSPSEIQEDQQSPQPGMPLDGLGTEDLSGVLDGALDDVDDEDMDGDTEDTEIARDREGASEEQDVDEDEDGENENESKHDESGEANVLENEAVDEVVSDNVDDEMETPHSEDQGDGDGDVAMTEQESDVEDEATPAAHTEDEDSEHPEEEGSHAEDDDDDDDDDKDEDDDEQHPPTLEVKKDVTSYPQKPTLNRPQLIEEELKDSGDELSDLSEFDDTDDSDEEEEEDEEAEGTNKAKASTNSSASNSAATTSRPAPGTRKRSLREISRDLKEQDEKMKRGSKDNEGTNDQHSDKETESEVAEEEDVEEEKAEGDDEIDEEEDLEKKQLHMDALNALTTIEIEFATLRDKMYEERMLELDREVEMINDGTHPELSTLMKEIEDKREQRLRVAKAWRTHMGEIAQCEFEIKEYQAHCTFQSKKREIRNDITQKLGKTKRRVILELTLASDSRRKNAPADKLPLVRARRHRRAEVNELRAMKVQYGFPASVKPQMVSTNELEDDFMAMGLPRPAIQPNAVEHGSQYPGRSMGTSSSPRLSTAIATQKWSAPSDYPPYPRSEVEIYVDGNRCKVDGIWYKPNDAVAVLDASIGQYNAKYLLLTNDEILLQKTDGSKTRLHLNLFRAKKLCMQPRP